MLLPVRGCVQNARVGAHLVEFAFVIPFFLLFVFGLIEISRGMMVSTLVTNAARTGCRVGVVPGRTNSDVTAAVDSLLTTQGVTGHTTTITVNGSTGTNVSGGQMGDTVLVTVSVPIAQASWLPALSFMKGDITGQFSIPHE